MAISPLLNQISQATLDVQAAVVAANQAAANGDITAAFQASTAAEIASTNATLAADQIAVNAAQAAADLAAAVAANADPATLTQLETASAAAQVLVLQSEAAILALGNLAKQAAAPVKALTIANPALGVALDANPALLAANAQQLQLKAVVKQAAATAKNAVIAATAAQVAIATATNPAAAKQQAAQLAAQAVVAQNNLLAADQSIANTLNTVAAAEAAALAAALAVQPPAPPAATTPAPVVQQQQPVATTTQAANPGATATGTTGTQPTGAAPQQANTTTTPTNGQGLLNQISQATLDVQAAVAAANQAVANGDITAAFQASTAAEIASTNATLAADQIAVAAAQAAADLAAAVAAKADPATLTQLQTASAAAQVLVLQSEAAILALGTIAKQAATPFKTLTIANPALGLALDANPALLAANAQQLQLKSVVKQAAASAKSAVLAATTAQVAIATAADPAAAQQQAAQLAAQAVVAQNNLLAADQAIANTLNAAAAAEAAAIAAALGAQGAASTQTTALPQGQAAQGNPNTVGAVITPAAGGGVVDPAAVGGTTNSNGLLTDQPTVWKGTELKQAFSFNLSDLSLLAYKALGGQMRALSTLANNTIGSQQERSREALGTNPVDTQVTPAEYGSGDDAFVRLTDVNNYAGPGDISQGVGGAAVAGRLQLQNPDGTPAVNERQISNELIDQGNADVPQSGGWNNLFMGAGQYIDHGLDLLNKGGQGSFRIPLPAGDELLGKVPGNELQLLPRGTSVDTTPGQGRYMNTVTASIDQNQLYGSDAVIHSYLREKDHGLVTAKMLDNTWSKPSADGTEGLPTFYDVLINNGADKDALDAVLNNADYQEAHAALAAWDAKVRGGDPSVSGNPFADGMGAYIQTLGNSIQELIAAAGDAWVDPKSVLPDSNQQLLGDASPLSGFDAISLTEHRIAGDLRANENPQLTAFHTVFHNFHNNTVDAITAAIAELPDDAATTPGLEQLASLKEAINTEEGQQAIFDMARMVVSAAYQRMVYDQYVVGLVGGIPFGLTAAQDAALMPDPNKLLPQPLSMNEHGYNGWQPEVRPSIALEFSTAGFRVGHSQIAENLNGITVETVNEITTINDNVTQSLIQSFINPSSLDELGGPAGVLAANANQHAQAIDTWLVNAVRNMLVGRPNDLGSFNLARANEVGLPTLNEFRQSISNLLETTGIGSALGAAASDVSTGIVDPSNQKNLLAERLKPYATWQEFGDNLRDPGQLVQFMSLFGGSAAAADNNIGLVNVPLWLGGLAEKPVSTPTGEGNVPSLVGSTFSYMVQESFDRAQDFDRWYYKIDIPGTDIIKQLSFQTFTPLLQNALGKATQFIHQDTFRTFAIDSLAASTQSFQALPDVRDASGRTVNRLILGNQQDNIIIGSNGSDDIRGGAGNDTIDGSKGADWIYGQGGNDTLYGGKDNAVDHLFGGEGDDFLVADKASGDALFGENGNDILIRQNVDGIADGGLGDDLVIGGKGNDVIYGDSGAPDAINAEGNDKLFGGAGDDVIVGGGGSDLIVGGDSAAIGDSLIGDAMADANAELLARAIRDENGQIVSTILPLFTDLGYAVTVGGVNPLTGATFTESELQEFRDYIGGLRNAPDPQNPANRGPQPVMVVMPYTGKAGNDIIYTGNMDHARELLMQLYGRDPRYANLLSFLNETEQLKAQPDANLPTDGITTDTLALEAAQVENGADPIRGGGLRPRAALNLAARVDKVFAGGGNDQIYTDGAISTVVFGGAGTDELNASSEMGAQTLQLSSIGTNGPEGVIVNENGTSDSLYSIEKVILNDNANNSLIVSEPDQPIRLDFTNAYQGSGVAVSHSEDPTKAITVSGIKDYTLSDSNQDRIVLGGKLNYNNTISDNHSNDNYQISWNGKELSINSASTGKAVVKGAEWIDFSYQGTNNPSGGIQKEFYYKEFAEKAVNLGLNIVKYPEFQADAPNELILRQFGSEQERSSKYYLAVTAESLRDASIDTLDFTVNLGQSFSDVFTIDPNGIFFTGDLAAQRQVQVLDGRENGYDGPSIRFQGAGLSALGTGVGIKDNTPLAYLELTLRPDIEQKIISARDKDAINEDRYSVEQHFSVNANVDQVVFSDLLSLRDLGGQYAMSTNDLTITARAANADLTTGDSFDLGTDRQVTKPGEGSHTNLIRSGDTILQTSTWRNDGEFSLSELTITDQSNDVAQVTSVFENGTSSLDDLSWSNQPGNGASTTVTSSFHITGEAGSVVDTKEIGFSISALGEYQWDTTKMNQFATKHLVTYAGDLNYDGTVDMKDLAFLNAGAGMGTNPHDVDANFDGSVDMLDLSIIDADWGKPSLHTNADTFTGSNLISMAELAHQGNTTWDISAFKLQNEIESLSLQAASDGHERDFGNVINVADKGNLSSISDFQAIAPLLELQNQQFGTTNV